MRSRRSFLAAAAAALAGCGGRPSDDGTGVTDGQAGTTTATPPRTTEGRDAEEAPTPTSDASAITHWTYEPGFGAVGSLSLAPGAGGPAMYVGSAAAVDGGPGTPSGGGEHGIAAVSLPDGAEQWELSLPGPPSTQPTLGGHDGPPRLYLGVAGVDGKASALVALDFERGSRVWSVDAEPGLRLLPLAAGDDAVFVGRRDDDLARSGEHLAALAAADGGERWRVESGDAVADGHALRRGTLVASTHGRIIALDPATAAERWRIEGSVPVHGPALDGRGERVFLGTDGEVRAIGLADGEEHWRRGFDFDVSAVTRPRAAMSTTVHVGDAGGRVLALSPLDGTVRWRYTVDAEGLFRPCVQRTSESLFVSGAGLHCLEPVSGDRRWTFEPAAAGNLDVHASTAVFAAGPDTVWALDPSDGEVRWAYAPEAGVDGFAAAGEVAVVASGGTVRALDGSGRP